MRRNVAVLLRRRRRTSGTSPNVNARPGAGVLSLVGYAPTVTGTAFTEATPGVGAISLVGYAPTASAVANVPTLTINSIGPQAGTGDVPFSYTISATATCQILIALAATAAPSAVDFGSTSGGGANAGGYTTITATELDQSGSPVNIDLPTGLDTVTYGQYKVYFLPPGGGDGDIAASGAVDIDTTAPAYASSTPADNGTDIAIDTTIAITFNEAIAAGTGTFALNDVTGAATVETFTVGGTGDNGGTISISTPTVTLTPGADLSNSNSYSVRWTAGAITDAKSNPVDANSGDTLLNFTTVAGGASFTVSYVDAQSYAYSGTTPSFTLDLSGLAAGTTLYIFYGRNAAATGMTINSNACTLVHTLAGGTEWANDCYSYVLPGAGGATDVLDITAASSHNAHVIEVWAVTGSHSVVSAGAKSATSQSVDITPTGATNVILGVAFSSTTITSVTWGGLTEVTDSIVYTSHETSATLANAPTGSATTATITNDVDDRSGLILLAISST